MPRWEKREKPVKTVHKKLGEIKVEIEIPQTDGATPEERIQDFIKLVGSAAIAADIIDNAVLDSGASNSVRSAGRAMKEDITLEDAIAALQKIAHDYTPQAGRSGVSVKAKAEKFDLVRDMVAKAKAGELSNDDFEAQLLALVEMSK